jgi:predicted SAM-dependent methyltransferase
MPHASETSKHRGIFEPYVQGDGLDIGFGGDPIRPSSITIDLPGEMVAGYHPTNLVGDAASLPWFRSGVLSYVYSSHCLEDFQDTEAPLREWLRVIQPGGFLCLLLPDQRKYVRHRMLRGEIPNQAHKHSSFGLEFVKRILHRIGGTAVVYENNNLDEYNIALVVKKL